MRMKRNTIPRNIDNIRENENYFDEDLVTKEANSLIMSPVLQGVGSFWPTVGWGRGGVVSAT